MTTQVIFKLDSAIKKKAQKVAKKYGSTFSAYLQQASYDLVAGAVRPGLVIEPERFNAKTRRIMDKALKDIKEGKNLVGPFNNAKEAIAYLKNRHAR
jgi:antitoxin component of RelBE/YafQ-DinJ toxin-antitoxin module